MFWQEIKNEEEIWNFIYHLPFSSGFFLQTPAWQKFLHQQKVNTKTLGWYSAIGLQAIVLLARHKLPAGFFYWFAPKGPIWAVGVTDKLKVESIIKLLELIKKDKALFARFEPVIERSYLQLQFSKAVRIRDVNPRATSIVDLKLDFQEILAKMHPKTRYNYRLAKKKGLIFRWGNISDFDNFWQLLQITAKRDNFRTHNLSHYRGMIQIFGQEPINTRQLACRLGLVELSGKLLAASLILIANKQAVYLHGASSREYQELMASYLLHGETIKYLKQAGCETYDLWGVQPKTGELLNWTGFSRFKLGWGGEYYESAGTFDFPIYSTLYFLYKTLRHWRD